MLPQDPQSTRTSQLGTHSPSAKVKCSTFANQGWEFDFKSARSTYSTSTKESSEADYTRCS